MRRKFSKSLSLVLAGLLQVAPIIKNVITGAQALSPVSWAVVLRLGTGAAALFGFHAVSSASSIAISPVNATNGAPYVGTVTYSGSHAGSVSSMTMSNLCLSSYQNLFAGLKIIYAGANKATVSGTPTNSGTFPFALKMWDGSCNSGLSDTRSASLVIVSAGGGAVAPSIVAPPESLTAQVGSDVLFSAGATGNPVPNYYWYQGIPSPATLVSTNSSFSFTNVQLANSGLYTVRASNSSGFVNATAYLSVCTTAGSNFLAFNYTNYFTVSNPLVMTSFITNVPAGLNSNKWQYNYVDVNSYGTNNSNFSLAANQVYAAHSGVYTVVFLSGVGTNTIVPQQAYDSYWAFGTRAAIGSSPQGATVPAGTNVTFSVSATVQQNPYGNNLNLGFLWYKDGTLISTQNSIGTNQTATLSLTNVQSSSSGSYTVVVTNYWGSTTSAPAVLAVSSPPIISLQPSSKSVLSGQTINFSVTASGGSPLSYQWKKGSSPLSDGGVYSGSTISTLTLTGVQPANADGYSVVVTNSSGSVTSSIATLTVSSPPNVTFSSVDGNLQLNANTATGLTYLVQTTFGLSNPPNWISLSTNVVPPSGVIVCTNSATNILQFFRLKFP